MSAPDAMTRVLTSFVRAAADLERRDPEATGDVLLIVRRMNEAGRYVYEAHHMPFGEGQPSEGPARPNIAVLHDAVEDVIRWMEHDPDVVIDWIE